VWLYQTLGFCAIVENVRLVGMPRRYYDYTDARGLNEFYEENLFISIRASMLLLGQLLFVFNFCYSIFRRKG